MKSFIAYTLVAAATASLASWIAGELSLAIWVMFAGFIAWFTRPASVRTGASAMLCLWLGIALGAGAFALTGRLVADHCMVAVPVVVFLLAIVVVGLRSTPIVDNMLAWFIGVSTFFAASTLPAPLEIAKLIGATAIGGAAAWTLQQLGRPWAPLNAH